MQGLVRINNLSIVYFISVRYVYLSRQSIQLNSHNATLIPLSFTSILSLIFLQATVGTAKYFLKTDNVQNLILMRIFGPKRKENEERTLHIEKINSLYHSPNIITDVVLSILILDYNMLY